MRSAIAAVLALAAASPLLGQAMPDLSTVAPIAGDWTYAPTADGSEAVFASAATAPQLWVHCTRATRRVTIAKPASAAAASMNVWTSTVTKSVPSSFTPANARLAIDLAAYDPLLDAIIASRGRVGFGVTGQPPLVLPPWAEIARVVEDCRA